MIADITPRAMIERETQLKTLRQPYEGAMRELATYLRPLRQEMRRTIDPTVVFDGTQLTAVDNLAAGLYGTLTNPANNWLAVGVHDQDLMRWGPARDWLDTCSHIVLKSLGPAISPFYSTVSELYMDTGSFGWGMFYSAQVPGQQRFYDVTISGWEVCVARDAWGQLSEVFRRTEEMTAAQLIGKFGGDSLPEKVRKETDAAKKFPVLHAVFPNPDMKKGRIGWRGKPMVSMYVLIDEAHQLRLAGYDNMPYDMSRWATTAGEIYATGPGHRGLPDIKLLNKAKKDLIIMSGRMAKPHILAADQDSISPLRMVPDGISYGTMSRQGKALVSTLQQAGNLPATLEMLNEIKEQIKAAFYFSLMQLAGRSGMTATEYIGQQEERMRLMAPNQGRIQTEFLSPFITRRFDMLNRMGQIPEPPEELKGKQLEIIYQSPMAKAQKAAEAHAVIRTAEAVGLIAQIKPEVAQRLNADKMVEIIQDGFGAPASILLDAEEASEGRDQQQQMAGLMEMLQAGGQGADIVKKLAQAQGAAQGQGAAPAGPVAPGAESEAA